MDHQFSDRDDLFRQSADQSRLLEGENPESTAPEDTVLWVGVYGELLELSEKLLAKMDAELTRMTEAVDAASADMTLIERKQRRYRRRLAFWEARAREFDRPLIRISDQPN